MHDTAVHRGPQALHVARGGDGDHIDSGAAAFADGAHDVQPRDVGQVNVEQDEVRLRLVDQPQPVGAGPCLADHAESRHLLDIGSVERRHAEVVVHDQRADHAGVTTGRGLDASGRRTVNMAPPWLTTVTRPSRRAATCLTRARPRPRRDPGAATLVV